MFLRNSKPVELNLGAVHLWHAKSIQNLDELNKLSEFLSADEVLKASKFRFKKDRAVYITGRFLLRTLLGHYLDIAPKEIFFKYSQFGKPSYLKNLKLAFNISHSGNRIIIGFTREQMIGVDIEKIKNDFNVLELAQNFFSKLEIEALEKLPKADLPNAFFRCWTRKESFIKAIGEGLSYPLDSFTVSLDDDMKAEFLKIDNVKDSLKSWNLYSFVPAEGYITAITTNGETEKIDFFDANTILLKK